MSKISLSNLVWRAEYRQLQWPWLQQKILKLVVHFEVLVFFIIAADFDNFHTSSKLLMLLLRMISGKVVYL